MVKVEAYEVRSGSSILVGEISRLVFGGVWSAWCSQILYLVFHVALIGL